MLPLGRLGAVLYIKNISKHTSVRRRTETNVVELSGRETNMDNSECCPSTDSVM